jgi:hypothetical protein
MILGGIIYIITFNWFFRVVKLPEGLSVVVGLVLCSLVPFVWGEQIKSSVGLSDEIRLTEMVKPTKVYSKLEVSDFKLTKFEVFKKDSWGQKKENTFMIGYTVKIKNVGDPIITIDDPNGTNPVGFFEDLVLRKLDDIEGKEDYINFGDVERSDLFDLNGNKIEYSTTNPIKTNDTFVCEGKILVDKENLNTLFSRKYEPSLYIRFSGTTKDKYEEPNGYGFIIKQDDYKIDLTNFLSENSDLIKSFLK